MRLSQLNEGPCVEATEVGEDGADITKAIKKTTIKMSLNFGLTFNFRSSDKPRIKNNVQNDKYS